MAFVFLIIIIGFLVLDWLDLRREDKNLTDSAEKNSVELIRRKRKLLFEENQKGISIRLERLD